MRKIEQAKKIKGVEEIRHQLSYFLKVIHAFSQRIQMINAMARQLLQHPNSQEIENRKGQNNACWAEFFARANAVDASVPVSAIGEKFQTKFMSKEKMMYMARISTSDSPSNIYIQILDQQFKKFSILENEMNIVLKNAAIKLESSQI